MKMQCTKTTVKHLIRMALVVVMLVTLICFGAVMASAAEKTIDVEIDDLAFVNVTQNPSNPYLLYKEYGTTWEIKIADGADIGIDAADLDKVSVKVNATLDNENVGMRTITLSYTLVTDDDALRAKYALPSAETLAVEVLPKQLTWVGGNASIAFTYGDSSVLISNSKLSNMPTLSGVLPGDSVSATINATVQGDKVSTATAGKHTAWTTVKVDSSNPNYTIADLVVDANVQKLTIVSTDLGEKFFTWGDAVVIEAYGTDANGKVHKLIVKYDQAAADGNVGSYVVTVASPDADNIAFATTGVTTSAAYHIQPKTFVVSFADRTVIGDRNNVFHPAVAGEVPADIMALVSYTSGGVAFNGTAVYGEYTVKAELPSSANYIFKNAAGDTVTSLTAKLTVKSQELIPAGSEGKPYQIVLYSENGYVGSYTASVTIPELARKTMRGLPHYVGYTLKIDGAQSETFTAVIPIDATLYQKGCENLTINDIYVYETATDEMVKANGHNGYTVLIKDNCFYVSGVSGSASVTFVIAPEYTPSFWITAPGIAVIVLIVLAILVLMFIIGMYLRRAEAAENEELVMAEGETPAFATAEEETVENEEEKLDALAEQLAAEEVAEETAEVDGVAEAVEEAKADLMNNLPELEEQNDDAIEAVAMVETDDDDEDEDFGGFGTADLDFFDALEEPERYAALLEQEKNGEVRIITRYRRSFQSKLAQSQGNVSDYYNAIKNALLSYKGIKSRISWNYEAFNRGRVHVAKIIAKTKTLYVYLAIDPATLQDSKYTFVDVSSKKKYASVPVLMKVKGERKFKHVLELIDKIGTESLNLPKLEKEEVDYRIPYASTEDLVAQGLVKKLVAGLPLVAEEETAAETEEATAAATPATEEQTVTFVAPTDTPAVEAAAEEIAAEETAPQTEAVPAAEEISAEDEGKEI